MAGLETPWLWEEDDLLSLVANQVQESSTLDYKASGALDRTEEKKREIGKDVSAFANSAGGILVYGIREKGHLPEAVDDGVDPSILSREWLEQVINSRIQRRVSGVVVKQILLHKTAPGRVAYVVSVPQSADAPHQADDKKFYKRFNFQSVAMEEYEVRDVANRLTAPDLSLRIGLRHEGVVGQGPQHLYLLSIAIENRSPIPAVYAVVMLGIEVTARMPGGPGPFVYEQVAPVLGGLTTQMHRLSYNWSIPGCMPIMAGARFTIAGGFVQLAMEPGAQYWFKTELLTPRATKKEAEFLHRPRASSFTLNEQGELVP